MKHFLRFAEVRPIRTSSLLLGCFLVVTYLVSSREWKPNIVHGSTAKGVTGHLRRESVGTVLTSVSSLFRENGWWSKC